MPWFKGLKLHIICISNYLKHGDVVATIPYSSRQVGRISFCLKGNLFELCIHNFLLELRIDNTVHSLHYLFTFLLIYNLIWCCWQEIKDTVLWDFWSWVFQKSIYKFKNSCHGNYSWFGERGLLILAWMSKKPHKIIWSNANQV